MANVEDCDGPLNYLIAWIGLIGAPVGLYVPLSIAKSIHSLSNTPNI
jgi:hypothetical protein